MFLVLVLRAEELSSLSGARTLILGTVGSLSFVHLQTLEENGVI